MKNFQFADLHCHPNLKAFGHSFDSRKSSKSDIWSASAPAFISKKIHQYVGVTKFTQTDFTTLARSRAKIVFVSLYPLEKGYFLSRKLPPALAAFIANWSVELGYKRVRYLQQHTNYFDDLQNEYQFVVNSSRKRRVDNRDAEWVLTNNWEEVNAVLAKDGPMAVILTIEGGHVFNSGLSEYGANYKEEEIIANVYAVKNWAHVPAFVGLAHNFNNDLCGHARSLHRLGSLVCQKKNLNNGLTPFGVNVIRSLLDDTCGKRIYIDMKHMSLQSRQEYFSLLKTEYANQKIPLIVSHGSVTGTSLGGIKRSSNCADIFNDSDLNFFDEEIVGIAKSGGLFGLQMDTGNNADVKKLRIQSAFQRKETPLERSARIIWCQMQYVAELLDSHGLPAWNSISIGSDFDGNINPLPGILTAADIQPLATSLTALAEKFQASHALGLAVNRNMAASEVIHRFVFLNTVNFLRRFY